MKVTLDELMDIEAIRQLRIRYSYCLDAGELDDLATLFVDDAVCDFGPFGIWRGRKEIRSKFGEVMAPLQAAGPFQTLHANTNHWVELSGPDLATGRAYLIDLALNDDDKNPLVWLGVYDEVYCRVDGEWLIQRSALRLLWPKRSPAGG